MENPHYRYASIDIGSNAVRLLLCNAVEEHGVVHFKKSELVRMPLRLGEDVFDRGRIKNIKATQLVKTMHAFRLLIDVFGPVSYRACATASFREASNSSDLIRKVKRESGIQINIISGKEEARLIYGNQIERLLDPARAYIYIDVGGGSTELTIFDKGKIIASQSFDVGTIRWLKGKMSTEEWNTMKAWVKKNTSGCGPLTAIGSGGNINKIFKIIDKREKPISYLKLKEFYEEIRPCSIEERMEIWQLNPDRADVIVPAARIYLAVMKTGRISEIIVPQIGLSDGIVHQLHEEHMRSVNKRKPGIKKKSGTRTRARAK
jgi:exopolyphosphatase/guanosine-5'-triphosphate,3'-diphosphate pyrophosphatase